MDNGLKIESILNDVEHDINFLKMKKISDRNRHVKVGLSPLAAAAVFPVFYQDFMQKYPNDVIEIYDLRGQLAETVLLQNEYDICIEVSTKQREDREFMASMELGRSELVFLCGKNNSLAQREYVTVEDLKNIPIASLGDFSNYSLNIIGLKPNYQFQTGQSTILRQVLVYNDYGSVHFKGIMMPYDDIVKIPFKPRVYYPIRLIWNKDRKHTDAFKDFIEYMKENQDYLKERCSDI